MSRRNLRVAAIALGVVASTAVLVACSSMMSSDKEKQPLALAPNVDLPRFMGDWYVIANIPTYFERGAHNAVESYRLGKEGEVDIRFTYRDDSFDGAAKEMTSKGFVPAATPAVWGVQFIWPLKADYRISYVSDDYGLTVITREKRDYVWIMARTPQIPEAAYDKLVAFVAAQGYDMSKLQRVPQQPAGSRAPRGEGA